MSIRNLFSSDTSPNAFGFTSVTNSLINTLNTSETITPNGYSTIAYVYVDNNGEISINGNTTWVSSSYINPGETIAVRGTSSNSFTTEKVFTVTIGSTKGTYSVTTAAQDLTPNTFTFTAQTKKGLSTLYYSNIITVSGITGVVPVTVSGGYANINGGGLVTSGTIQDGQTLQAAVYSSASHNSTTTATVNVGTYSTNFSVTTGDVGTTWIDTGSNTNPGFGQYAIIEYDGRYFYSQNSSILYLSNLSGSSWSQLSLSYSNTGIYTPNRIEYITKVGNNYFAVEDHMILKSTNLSNWTAVANTNKFFGGITSDGISNIFATTYTGVDNTANNFISTNGGNTFSQAPATAQEPGKYVRYASSGYYYWEWGGTGSSPNNLYITKNPYANTANNSYRVISQTGDGTTGRYGWAYGSGVYVVVGYYYNGSTGYNGLAIKTATSIYNADNPSYVQIANVTPYIIGSPAWGYVNSVFYANNKFAVILQYGEGNIGANTSTVVLTSTDGLNWVAQGEAGSQSPPGGLRTYPLYNGTSVIGFSSLTPYNRYYST